MPKPTIHRGGAQLALYLRDDEFDMPDGSHVSVRISDIPSASAGMEDVIARHKARYGLVSLFCRPGKHVLDFPCGSGYSTQLLHCFGVTYEGRDIDEPTVEFARRQYGSERVRFNVGDLCQPTVGSATYDVVACIEGLEHIDAQYQAPLIQSLHYSLRPGGTLVVSSPEAVGKSGPSATNPEHKWELSGVDFVQLLTNQFGPQHVEIVSQRNIVLSTGVSTTCLYGVCHREA
jgi:SAM-dependent methyltransferase